MMISILFNLKNEDENKKNKLNICNLIIYVLTLYLHIFTHFLKTSTNSSILTNSFVYS